MFMIQHIRYFIFLILIFGNFSCKQENKSSAENKIADSVTLVTATNTYTAKSANKVDNFVFYKSFAFCNSEVGYFSQKQADSIYSDKVLNIDNINIKNTEASSQYSDDEWKCIKNNLKTGSRITSKKVETDESFPFDNMMLINDKYLIAPRDGYFFVFIKSGKTDNNRNQQKSVQNVSFETVFNTKLVGLSLINDKEKNISNKYKIDFTSQCLCNSPSIYIDKQKSQLILFNYCDGDKKLNAIKNKYTFNILTFKTEGNILALNTRQKVKFILKQVENQPVFKLETEGKLPTDYIGNEMKVFFTSQSGKFQKEDCGDFGG